MVHRRLTTNERRSMINDKNTSSWKQCRDTFYRSFEFLRRYIISERVLNVYISWARCAFKRTTYGNTRVVCVEGSGGGKNTKRIGFFSFSFRETAAQSRCSRRTPLPLLTHKRRPKNINNPSTRGCTERRRWRDRCARVGEVWPGRYYPTNRNASSGRVDEAAGPVNGSGGGRTRGWWRWWWRSHRLRSAAATGTGFLPGKNILGFPARSPPSPHPPSPSTPPSHSPSTPARPLQLFGAACARAFIFFRRPSCGVCRGIGGSADGGGGGWIMENARKPTSAHLWPVSNFWPAEINDDVLYNIMLARTLSYSYTHRGWAWGGSSSAGRCAGGKILRLARDDLSDFSAIRTNTSSTPPPPPHVLLLLLLHRFLARGLLLLLLRSETKNTHHYSAAGHNEFCLRET